MANFRKSFNFRNGVQVDEDNFIVNSAGLVGIGTSVPTEFLDVRGSLKVVGVATIQDAFIGVATVQNKLEVGITSFRSGIITATSTSGIVTYYGDARYLQGMPTSQWVDVDAGLGYTSIYAAGNVGVGTVDPRFTFQVGGNNDVSNFARGVGISSVGDVRIAGILTVTQFYGWGIGVTGINAGDAISSGTLDNARLPSNISVSGIVTSGSFVTGPITSGSITASGNVSATGIVTATGGFVGNVTGTASTAQSLTGTPNVIVGVITASKLVADTIEVPSTGITTVSRLLHVGTGGTAFAALESGRIGVGTAIPTRSLQIVENTDAAIELISESGETKIIFGQQVLPSVGVGDSSAVLRFGNADKTFDIIQNDTGSLNMYLHSGAAGVDTGRFNWVYGQSNAELMSLTYDGKLGIAKTNPDHNLHVVGTSTVTGNSYIGGDLSVSGSIIGDVSLTQVTANAYVTSGVSTYNDLDINGDLTLSGLGSVGISTNSPIVGLDARGNTALFERLGIGTDRVDGDNFCVIVGSIAIPPQGNIGIGTTTPIDLTPGEFGQIQFFTRTIDMNNSLLNIRNDGAIGFNTYLSRSVFDYGRVGSATTNPYMILPTITTGTRTGLAQTVEGAIIFNTTTKKFQGYTGTAWVDLH
jgi:hypothetical protein